MATNYNSTHTGAQTDAYDARISALETALATLQTQMTNATSNISSIQTNYATKAQVNSISILPNGSSGGTDIPMTNSAKKTAWTVCFENWTAPSNGWIYMTFGSTSSTPSIYINTGNTIQVRVNGNGSRDFHAIAPVKAGGVCSSSYIYCAVTACKFIPAQTI